MKSKENVHVSLGEASGENSDLFLLRKGNFNSIREFKYGQTGKI